MRILKEVPHPHYKISIFTSNNKFIVRYVDRGVAINLRVPEHAAQNIMDVEHLISSHFNTHIEMPFRQLHRQIATLPSIDDEIDDLPTLI